MQTYFWTMIIVFSIIILLISGYVIIPSVNAESSMSRLQNPLSYLSSINQIGGTDQNSDLLLLSTANMIGSFPPINLSDVQSFEQYQKIVDRLNLVIKFLKEHNPGIPVQYFSYLKGTQEEYEKISKSITKFSPLINEYNDMIAAAKSVKISDQDSINNFYIKSAVFAIVLILVVTSVYSAPSYVVVGILWRASGLTGFAVKCPICVSVALSKANGIVNASFVESTAIGFTAILQNVSRLSSLNMYFLLNPFTSKFNPTNLLSQINK